LSEVEIDSSGNRTENRSTKNIQEYKRNMWEDGEELATQAKKLFTTSFTI
jgi:hypothetical protein